MSRPITIPMADAVTNPTSSVCRLLARATISSPLSSIVIPARTMALGYDMNSGLMRRPPISQATSTTTIDTSRMIQDLLRARGAAIESSAAASGAAPLTLTSVCISVFADQGPHLATDLLEFAVTPQLDQLRTRMCKGHVDDLFHPTRLRSQHDHPVA